MVMRGGTSIAHSNGINNTVAASRLTKRLKKLLVKVAILIYTNRKAMKLAKKAHNMPALPGIYIFKNDQNMPIYIGKAKVLKKRISSYFVAKKSDWKTKLLLSHATGLEHIVTKTETEALLFEAELIKQHQPMFNILLKDGQPFVYLVITKEQLPQLKLVRNKKTKGTYFGPFIYKGQARSVYRFLLEHLQLYVCNKKIENGCLQYHLGKCSGTCKTNFDLKSYLFRLSLAKHILKGDNTNFKKQLTTQIKTHSKNLEFEAAQKLAKIQESLGKIVEIIKLKFDKEPALGGSMLRYDFEDEITQHERNNKILHPLAMTMHYPHLLDLSNQKCV
jgi:excinuclease ABC subunit C